MVMLKCKMCGGDLKITEGSSVCECEYCGSRQTVPSIDDEKKIKLYERANKLRLNCEFDRAYGVYESIVEDFDNEAEAYWGLILCKYGIEYIDDPKTGRKIPTCHRSSYESVLDDDAFDMIMECASIETRSVYREQAIEIEEIRKAIIEKSSKEEPYDIFICYKETDENGDRTIDSVLAQDIYTTLTKEGYKVFFARISLESKLGSEYEPIIFSALQSAKVMLAIGTKYDYYHAVWVRNEWSRYLKMIESGDEKTLVPCYKNISPYDMPKEFKHLQAQDMGKVGAIQDLVRGIKKIIKIEDKEEQKQQTTVVGDIFASILNKAKKLLEQGNFAEAKESYLKVLDFVPNREEALLGVFLCDLKVKSVEEVVDKSIYFAKTKAYNEILLNGSENLINKLKNAENTILLNLIKQIDLALEKNDFKAVRTLCEKALQFDGNNKKVVFALTLIDFYKEFNVSSIEELANGTEIFANSQNYKKLFSLCENEDKEDLKNAEKAFYDNLISGIETSFEQGYYKKSAELCSKVLTITPDNEKVKYTLTLIEFLTEFNVSSIEELANGTEIFINSQKYQKFFILADDETKEKLKSCEQAVFDNLILNIDFSLNEGIFEKTLEFCNKVFILDPNNEKSKYTLALIEFLTEFNVSSIEELASGTEIFINSQKYQKFFSLADDETKEKLKNAEKRVFENIILGIDETLKNKNFTKCLELCEKALTIDKSNEKALIGLLLCEHEATGFYRLKVRKIDFANSKSYAFIKQYGSEETKTKLASLLKEIKDLIEEDERKAKIKKVILICVSFVILIAISVSIYVINHLPHNLYKYEVQWSEITITGIKDRVFDTNEIVIPSEINGKPITSIGDDAFFDCSSLTSVTIPDTVTSIGDNAFRYCSSLTSITIPNSVTSIGDNAFSGCKIQEAEVPSNLVEHIPINNLQKVVISGGTSLDKSAFKNCSSLTSVTIPDSVTSIGYSAFSGCSSLTSVTMPNSVTSIGNEAFEGCSSLTSVTIPDSVTSIGDRAFNGCSSLTSVTMPNSVTSIGDSAFSGCISLTSITIPYSVINIGNSAFYGCRSLTSVIISDIVTSIGDSAFYGCSSLAYNEYDNGFYLGNESNPYLALISVEKNIKSIKINENTKIISDAFSGCSSLTSVIIPNSVTYIGDNAFTGCKIQEAELPSYLVKYIPKENLQKVIINGGTSLYESAFKNCSSLTSVTIPGGVTSIGDGAFYGCSSLTSVTIPDSVTSIGGGAFRGCSSLTIVTIPDSVTSIVDYAFYGCSSLTSVTIPDSVTSIGYRAFNGCSSLTSVTMPNSVTSIGDSAFFECSSLTSITIPDSVTSISWRAFSGCSSLTSITIPDSVTSIGDYAFYGCSSLTSVTIPDSVKYIGSYAFYGCSSLTSVVIPDSVTRIGEYAFSGCKSLTIYCKAKREPSGWGYGWNASNRPVVWGYNGEN